MGLFFCNKIYIFITLRENEANLCEVLCIVHTLYNSVTLFFHIFCCLFSETDLAIRENSVVKWQWQSFPKLEVKKIIIR